jgi:hypothetical protein
MSGRNYNRNYNRNDGRSSGNRDNRYYRQSGQSNTDSRNGYRSYSSHRYEKPKRQRSEISRNDTSRSSYSPQSSQSFKSMKSANRNPRHEEIVNIQQNVVDVSQVSHDIAEDLDTVMINLGRLGGLLQDKKYEEAKEYQDEIRRLMGNIDFTKVLCDMNNLKSKMTRVGIL